MFSTQLCKSCQTAASTIKDWHISNAMFCTGWMSLIGLGSGYAFKCTSIGTAWLLNTWSLSASQLPALMVTGICDLQAVVSAGFTDQDGNLWKLCFWTCRSIYLECSAKHSLMQFTLTCTSSTFEVATVNALYKSLNFLLSLITS